MAEKVEIEIDVKSNVQGSIAELKALKKELKNTAAGSAEFKRLANEIDDLEDKIKGSKQGAADWIDTLESAGGPIGAIGSALNKAKVATVSFGTALKATGIGLIVAAVGGLVAAFNNVEGAGKKLEPLMIGLEKILGGIFAALEPLIDAFLDLAMKALPYITKGIGVFYSGLVSLFTLLKEAGVGVGKILKGIFTLDYDAITQGWEQLTGSWNKAVTEFKGSMTRFEEGTKKMTKTEKENLKERTEAGNKALEERKKQMEAQDKLDEAALLKLKEQALAAAQTEQEKLDVEKQFAEKLYELKTKDLNDRLALEKKNSAEYKNILAELTQLQADKIAKDKEFAEKQKEISEKAAEDRKKANEEAISKEELDLELKKEKGLLSEAEYQQALYDMRVKYANDNNDLVKAEIELEKWKNEQKKKGLEEQRQILALGLQAQIEALDKENARVEGDFQSDMERLAQKRELLAQAEANELANTELTEFQKTEIRKKYADERRAVSDQEIATEKAAQQAKLDLQNAYLDLFANFGSTLQALAGKNKGLAIAGIIIEQAAAIGKIIVNTAAANAKAVAAFPLTAGMPWVAINTASAALGIAASVAGAAKSIREINSAASAGGIQGGSGTPASGGVGATPPTAPKVAGIATPQIQTGGGQNPNTALAETIATAQKPVRAYVVAQDVSSQQALDRRTNRGATFANG